MTPCIIVHHHTQRLWESVEFPTQVRQVPVDQDVVFHTDDVYQGLLCHQFFHKEEPLLDVSPVALAEGDVASEVA